MGFGGVAEVNPKGWMAQGQGFWDGYLAPDSGIS